MKQKYVKCASKDEWDFVTEKLNRNCPGVDFKRFGDCINIEYPSCSNFAENDDRTIVYSFEEWLNLNGYVIEKEDYTYLIPILERLNIK